ncbi:MAG: DUF302 domain-containing protein [Burkholderiales bacterium]
MKTFTVKLDVNKTVSRLSEAVADFPMGLVAHINGQANCAKRGVQVPADQILEVFRPDFAVRVWKAEKAAGIDIPLRIHCYDAGNGHTTVAFRTAQEVFAPYANPDLDKIGHELDVIFNELLNTLQPYLAKEAA